MSSTLPCGCIPDASGYGYCPDCERKLKEKIWRNMSAKDKDYDRRYAPEQSRALDEAVYEPPSAGCSCHINPPCSYCTSKKQ